MNKMKKMITLMLVGILTIAAPAQVFADGETKKPYISLGADLNDTEKAKVLELLGIGESDLSNYTVTQITNADEHKYLDSYLDSQVIGGRALSSVLVQGKEDGYGIRVITKNISYCTVGMYQNALATAGIKNADIIVAGPFEISGTAGLVGAIKSYEVMSGEDISDEDINVATNELVVTSELAETFKDPEAAEEMVGFIKNEVLDKDLSEEEMDNLIDQTAAEFQVEVSEEDKARIMELMESIKGMDLDVDELKEQIGGLYDRIQDLDIQVDQEEVKGFLSELLNTVAEFFRNLLNS